MSIPLGGFHFNIGFQTPGARASLAALRRDALQTADAIKQAFAGVSTGVNTTQTVAAINRVTQAARAAQQASNIRVQASVQNIQQTTQQLSQLTDQMRALAGTNTRLTITIASDQLQQQIQAARDLLADLTEGQSATINLRLPSTEARAAMAALKQDLEQAAEDGVTVKVNVDTKGAATDAKRAADAIAAEAKRAADDASRADAKLAADRKRTNAEWERDAKRAAAEVSRAQRQAEVADRRQQREQQRVAAQVNVKLDGDQVVQASLKEIGQLANLINRTTINVKVSENASKAKQQVKELADQIQQAKRGETIVVNAQVRHQAGLQAMSQLSSVIKAAEARGVKIVANIDTTPAKTAITQLAQLGSGALRGLVAGSGAGGGLLIGAGLAGGASVVLGVALAVQQLTQAFIGGLQSGTQYNAMLEQATQAFALFTGGSETAQQSLAQLRQYADITPFNTKETIAAGQAFAQVSAGNIAYMQRQVELAGQLAATNPSQGLEGAVRALRELQAGQVESIAERFNIPRSTIQRLKDAGLAGEELQRAVVKAAGGSDALVKAYGESFTGRLSTAQSAIEEFQRVASKPFFDVVSVGLGALNSDFERNKEEWAGLAQAAGLAAGQMARDIVALVEKAAGALKFLGHQINESKFLFDKIGEALGGAPAQRIQAAPPPPALTAAQVQNQAESKAALDNLTAQQKELAKQERLLKDVENAQKRVAFMVEFTKNQYEKLLEPLERQRRLVEDQLRGAEGGLARANELERTSQAPVGIRAEAASTMVVLEHNKALLEIAQRRRAITQEIADAEAKLADTLAERSIRAAEQQLDALRRIVAEQQAARRTAIDGAREQAEAQKDARDRTLEALREEVRGRQEARAAALEAIRDEIRARQEARTAVLEALREEIQARRDAYQQARDAAKEISEERERQYQREASAADRANQRRQEGFRREIESLQRRDQELRKQEQGKTPAEIELDALEKAERIRQAAHSLAQATTAVREARTGKERRDAIERLQELKAQQAVDRQREALRERADQEKAAREAAAARRQEEIAELQRRAQEADRRYQQEKEARDLQHQQQQEQLQAQQRTEDRAEKERQRQENERVKALEQADRELRRQEEARIREEERKDKELRRQEEAAIRSQEQANRQADLAARERIAQMERSDRALTRTEQAQVREAEAAIERSREELRLRQEARQAAADRQHLADLQASAAVELQILATRERVLLAENVGGLAIAAYWKTIYTDEIARLNFILGTIDRRVAAIKSAMAAALAPYEAMSRELKIQQLQHQLIIDKQKAVVDNAQKHLDRLGDIAKKLGEAALAQERIAKAADEWATSLERAKAAGVAPPGEMGPIDPRGPGGPGGKSPTLSPTSGLLDVYAWAWDQAKKLVDWIVKGFSETLNQNPFGPIAADSWSQKVIRALVFPWRTGSPSRVTIELANDVIDGWLQPWKDRQVEIELAMQAPFDSFLLPESGYMAGVPAIFGTYAIDAAQAFIDEWNNMDVGPTMEAPFIDVTDNYFPAALPKFGTFGQDAATRFREGWDSIPILESLQAPFEAMFNTHLPYYEQLWVTAGNNAMIAFANGWSTSPDLVARLSTNFSSLISWFGTMDPVFVRLGENAASAFCEGWRRTMQQECPCTTCGATTGGGGGGKPDPRSRPRGGGGGQVQFVGANAYARYEIPQGPQVGAFLPDSMLASARAGGGTGVGTGSTSIGGNVGPVSIQITNQIQAGDGIRDPQAFAQEIADQTVTQVISILDHSQRTAADRANQFLPGAL